MRYEAVFFDAGETLLAPHPSFHVIFSRVLAERGHEVAPETIEKAFEAVAPNFIEVLDSLGTRTWSTSRETSRKFWGAVYQAAFGELGIDDRKGALATSLYETFTKFESYKLFPDALPTLESVKQSGLIVGLISNFEEWLEEMLVHWKVNHLFDILVISGKEGLEKPDPEIFRIALQRAEVHPSKAVYVGDHPEIDAAASEAVGMKGVLIDRRQRHPGYQGSRIESLAELPPILGIG